MNAIVLVIGEGLLAELVQEQLSELYTVHDRKDFSQDVPSEAKLVLVLCDKWQSSLYLKTEEVLRRGRIPWLCGFVLHDEVVVGPLVHPDTPGCSQCADHRRHNSASMQEQFMNRLMHPTDEAVESFISRTGLWQAVHLLVAEARRAMEDSPAFTEQHVYLLNLNTLKCSYHHFIPNPLCPVCGRLPDDSSEAARISLEPRPKPNAESYRCQSIDQLKDVLVNDYFDLRTGIFDAKWSHLASPFTNASMRLPTIMGEEITGGRSHSYAESERIALLEGLERYCGMMPRGKRSVVHDTFHNLSDQALDPLKVGVYSQERYAVPGFPFMPFDPDRPIDWVWGYSFMHERPILVPEQLAYYSLGSGNGFVQETSNGCALGGSLEEAILFGILEVVERDSFLMTWYAKLPVPRLDPCSANDRELSLMIERLRVVSGYDVELFNTTMENGIPSIWALAINRKATGANLICGAGAHLDPLRAAKSAIHELANTMSMLQETFEEQREAAEQMFRDSFLVQQMSDHAMLYGLPQAEERLQFLLGGNRSLRSFDEEFKPRAKHGDLTDDLKDVLRTFLGLNLDIIVVNQTSPETLRNGLDCVKVLIPGMLPMTFGQQFTRLTGLERVFSIPVELGYAKQPLTVEQLNPYPHPFP